MPEKTDLERFLWMNQVLAVRPFERLLEIGCGSGLAVERIVPTLTTGKITAIDRSGVMLAKAVSRNRKFITEGKVQFIQKDLSALPKGSSDCDKIFAFNVNLFWTRKDIAKEIAVIDSYIKKDGQLFLFYQPPGKDKMKALTRAVEGTLHGHGYTTLGIIYEVAVRSCCVISRPQ